MSSQDLRHLEQAAREATTDSTLQVTQHICGNVGADDAMLQCHCGQIECPCCNLLLSLETTDPDILQ